MPNKNNDPHISTNAAVRLRINVGQLSLPVQPAFCKNK